MGIPTIFQRLGLHASITSVVDGSLIKSGGQKATLFRQSYLLVGDRDTCNGRRIILTHLIPAITAVTQ